MGQAFAADTTATAVRYRDRARTWAPEARAAHRLSATARSWGTYAPPRLGSLHSFTVELARAFKRPNPAGTGARVDALVGHLATRSLGELTAHRAEIAYSLAELGERGVRIAQHLAARASAAGDGEQQSLWEAVTGDVIRLR